MVFLILPGNSRRKPFRELYLDRYLNCFQTAPARDGDFCAQVAAQLNFYTLAANASIDNHGFDQGQVMPVKLQTVRLVGARKFPARLVQFFKLDPHIETPWPTHSPHQGASHKVANYIRGRGSFKTEPGLGVSTGSDSDRVSGSVNRSNPVS